MTERSTRVFTSMAHAHSANDCELAGYNFLSTIILHLSSPLIIKFLRHIGIAESIIDAYADEGILDFYQHIRRLGDMCVVFRFRSYAHSVAVLVDFLYRERRADLVHRIIDSTV